MQEKEQQLIQAMALSSGNATKSSVLVHILPYNVL